jgi:hypothetical protein
MKYLKIKTEAKLKILENNARLKKSFGVDFKVTKDLIPQSSWEKLFKDFFHTATKAPSSFFFIFGFFSFPI